MTNSDRFRTLETLWALWADRGRAMTDEQWQLPTRLAGWDVRSLYVHAGIWPVWLTALLGRVSDQQPTHTDVAALLRDFNAPDGIATRMRDQVAASARDTAAESTTEELVARFAETGPRAVTLARERGPVVVDYFGQGLLPLDEAAGIGVLEGTVHLLDLHDALGIAPAVPAEGLAETAAILTRMASPVAFVEAATGRRAENPFPVLT